MQEVAGQLMDELVTPICTQLHLKNESLLHEQAEPLDVGAPGGNRTHITGSEDQGFVH